MITIRDESEIPGLSSRWSASSLTYPALEAQMPRLRHAYICIDRDMHSDRNDGRLTSVHRELSQPYSTTLVVHIVRMQRGVMHPKRKEPRLRSLALAHAIISSFTLCFEVVLYISANMPSTNQHPVFH